jgi:ergothioneine biosynthesis protein EgtB
MIEPAAAEIAQLMATARADTLQLFDMAREEDLHVSPGFGFRPVIWHLAHIGVFESFWILQKMKGEPAPDERYERIFDPISTPREQSQNLPSRREMENYLTCVRERVLQYLEEVQFDEANPLLRNAYVFHLVLEHEYQHQETLAYLMQLLAPEKKQRPPAEIISHQSQAVASQHARDMIHIPAGEFTMGASEDAFAYDNEKPLHTVNIPAFKIDRLMTTNEEYASFIGEGGYKRREFWDEEGWAWRESENIEAPLYWSQGESWRVRRMFEENELQPAHPVVGISWYEANAYARFAGKRLPTEAEWEKAASWDASDNRRRRFAWGDAVPDKSLCNFGSVFWGTTPAGNFPEGQSAYGCMDMTGNAWEWTSDPFAGYPGFKAFPYPEYSEAWFDGDHRVLKGGSWATRAPLLRTSFRNFFRRNFRISFAGLRCASDA